MTYLRRIGGAGAALTLALLLAASMSACGGGDDDGDDGDGGEPTSAATTDHNGNGDDGASNELTIVSKNTLFNPTELKAPAGEITITHDNQDGGIIHNVRVYKGEDAEGEDMGGTDLEAGPIVQTLKLTLEQGEYFYVCQTHPATMYGKLEVE